MSRSFQSRKRGAPGASPLSHQQDFNNSPYSPVQDQLGYDPNTLASFLNPEGTGNLNGFGDGSGLDGTLYDNGLNGSSGGFDFTGNQLVRRNITDRDLVSICTENGQSLQARASRNLAA